MKAMILAAGRGERMRPLTDHTPKPLLMAGDQSLIEHHLHRLKNAGYEGVVINTHHLGEQLHEKLGNGERYGMRIQFSDESPNALETAGGIYQALPLLGDQPFLVVNGDVWCDHSLDPVTLDESDMAHLVLVENPTHHPEGDFVLEIGRVQQDGQNKMTFSGIGWYRPELFQNLSSGKQALGPLLRKAMDQNLVSGESFQGSWMDIGTPERLDSLRQQLATQN